MSCIAGIMNLDGAPVERELLKGMTSTMKARAPDESAVWCFGNVGFGHAMLRISPESEKEHQPCTLDGQIWITADARIDGRAELIGRLRSAGAVVPRNAPDPELILHAYSAFGDSFLQHIIGDFAFALWDNRHKKLVCARDQFGVRPFFYAKTSNFFAFASNIEAIFEHPAVSKVLDEPFIADFLLFSSCMEANPSAYRDIRRLPAASQISISEGRFLIRRYWDLPLHEVRYRKHSEYFEQFQALFEQAVSDRIRTKLIGLELSGGMDSTSIAAVATADARKSDRFVTAYTTTCHDLLPGDEEGRLAGTVASHLNIPIVYQAIGDYPLFERFGTVELATAEPFPNADLAMHYDRMAMVARNGARILLTGQGGDALYAGSSTYYADLLRSGRLPRFLADAYQHVRYTGSIAGMRLRSTLLRLLSNQSSWRPPFPDWINPDFAKRVQLEDRFETGWRALNEGDDLRGQLTRPFLSHAFEYCEALNIPVVGRHPFYDVRLVTFMLGLLNWSVFNKKIMRDAMRGRLPEHIRTRPTTGLVGDHFRVRFCQNTLQTLRERGMRKAGEVYIERERYIEEFERFLGGRGVDTTWSSWVMMTPIALDHWLSESK